MCVSVFVLMRKTATEYSESERDRAQWNSERVQVILNERVFVFLRASLSCTKLLDE